MSFLGGLLLGIIDIAIIVVVLVLIGAIIVMFARWMQWPIDWNVQRLYLLVVALIALGLVIALLLGIPTRPRIIGGFHTGGAIALGAAADHGT